MLSVLAALHENFRSYEIYITSAGDLLVVASNRAELPTPDWSVFEQADVQTDLCRFLPMTREALEGSRLVGRKELAPVLAEFGQPNSDYYPVLDLGAERRRYLRDVARGFNALSYDWYNLLSSVSGARRGPGQDTLAAMPETPRIRVSTLSARLRRWYSMPRDSMPADLELQQAAYQTDHWRARLSDGRAPGSWQLWLNEMWRVNRYWSGGLAGVADTAFFQVGPAVRRPLRRAATGEGRRGVPPCARRLGLPGRRGRLRPAAAGGDEGEQVDLGRRAPRRRRHGQAAPGRRGRSPCGTRQPAALLRPESRTTFARVCWRPT